METTVKIYGTRTMCNMKQREKIMASNNSRFECEFDDIYPPDILLKNMAKLSYLDIMITIDNGKYSTAVILGTAKIINFLHLFFKYSIYIFSRVVQRRRDMSINS